MQASAINVRPEIVEEPPSVTSVLSMLARKLVKKTSTTDSVIVAAPSTPRRCKSAAPAARDGNRCFYRCNYHASSSLAVRFNGHFPGEPGLAGVY